MKSSVFIDSDTLRIYVRLGTLLNIDMLRELLHNMEIFKCKDSLLYTVLFECYENRDYELPFDE